ncbi:hypothetical protein JZY91_01275 [Corynebacterium sp. CNCTC7651]|uniref:hypothetical protein n=1 Tax=Corynebacterium sp. CNCTC7651 TaxID=2815361 RepID=UPI001F19B8E0|nr:hypothetical protein [Corynebacterium sp. CNCTC7651]UIZ92471.1 hypothetical protein JZY91_01275 [Corynebacterium sp. CNCTC7651]
MRGLFRALAGGVAAATLVACGLVSPGSSESEQYARDAEAAGFADVVTYEAFSAGLPNNEVRAYVDLTGVEDIEGLLTLLDGQRLMFINVTQPNGRTASNVRREYLRPAFHLPELDARLPETDVWAAGRSLLIEGAITAEVLHEAAEAAEQFEEVAIGPRPSIRVESGYDPDRLAALYSETVDSSVTEILWRDGVHSVRAESDEVAPDGGVPEGLREELRFLDPYLAVREGTAWADVEGPEGKVIGRVPLQ